jgi:NAD(P)-dependent dehydrogenase (short-subunit alcohol dehydrogenase family)
MFSMQDKVAVVTGGTSGIGEAVCRRFAASGAIVVIAGRRDGSELAEELGGLYVRADVAEESQVKALMAAAAGLRGHIDVCVNNAGAMGEGEIVDTTVELMDRMYRVNTLGVFLCMKHAVGYMRAGGAIVNTASIASVIGAPGIAAYAASKTAVLGLTRVAAMEFGPRGIRVNCICPATVKTPMWAAQDNAADEAAVSALTAPLGRCIEPDEAAALIHFLAADDCQMVSGQEIIIDGGARAGFSEAFWSSACQMVPAD